MAWAPGTEWEVAAGMLDIFHKLPGQAKKFLETNGEPPCPSFLLLLSFKLFFLCCSPSSCSPFVFILYAQGCEPLVLCCCHIGIVAAVVQVPSCGWERVRYSHRPDCCSPLRAGERPGIVVLTIGLEESLPKLPGAVIPSKLWSPYRLPLVRFLNQYPTER